MQYGHPNCGWKLMHSNLMFGDGHDSWICVNSIHPTAEIFSNSLCWWYFQELWKKKVPPIWHSWVISIASYSWEFRGVFFKAWPLFSSTYCWFSRISNLAWMLFAAHNSARQWRQSWTFAAAVVCKALWPCGTMPATPASWWGSTEHRFPNVDTFHHLGFRLIERWFTQNNGDLIFWFTRTESYWNWMELETCWNK